MEWRIDELLSRRFPGQEEWLFHTRIECQERWRKTERPASASADRKESWLLVLAVRGRSKQGFGIQFQTGPPLRMECHCRPPAHPCKLLFQCRSTHDFLGHHTSSLSERTAPRLSIFCRGLFSIRRQYCALCDSGADRSVGLRQRGKRKLALLFAGDHNHAAGSDTRKLFCATLVFSGLALQFCLVRIGS